MLTISMELVFTLKSIQLICRQIQSKSLSSTPEILNKKQYQVTEFKLTLLLKYLLLAVATLYD